jgi:sporulation protein YlmC with PRC-barrel domain
MGKTIIFSSVLAFAAAGASFAAETANAQAEQTEERVVVVEQEEQQGQQAQAEEQAKETPPYQAAATKLMEKSVQDSQGKELGSVEDLLMDEQNQVSHVIVSSGGLLGLGGRKVALPIDQIEMQQDALVYSGDQQQFDNMPEFAYQEEAQEQQEQALGGGQAGGGQESETVVTETETSAQSSATEEQGQGQHYRTYDKAQDVLGEDVTEEEVQEEARSN